MEKGGLTHRWSGRASRVRNSVCPGRQQRLSVRVLTLIPRAVEFLAVMQLVAGKTGSYFLTPPMYLSQGGRHGFPR